MAYSSQLLEGHFMGFLRFFLIASWHSFLDTQILVSFVFRAIIQWISFPKIDRLAFVKQSEFVSLARLT